MTRIVPARIFRVSHALRLVVPSTGPVQFVRGRDNFELEPREWAKLQSIIRVDLADPDEANAA